MGDSSKTPKKDAPRDSWQMRAGLCTERAREMPRDGWRMSMVYQNEVVMVAGKKTGSPMKGKPNKNTIQLRDMIIEALDRKGGAEYLAEQADVNPVTFMGLLGKVMPTQVSEAEVGPIRVEHELSEAVRDIIKQIKDESC